MKITITIAIIFLFTASFCHAQLPGGTILHLKADEGMGLNGDKVVECQDFCCRVRKKNLKIKLKY